MPTFAEFLAPVDPVEFKRDFFDKRPLHIPASARTLANPLPWKCFNDALNIQSVWNEDTLKVFYRNRLALRENYCDVTDLAPGAKAAADPRKVKALLGFGASLVANQIQRVSPSVAAIVHMLQQEFAAGSGANVYCSFQGVQAFSTHYDLHDVFALQVEGEKRWHIYQARADHPLTPAPPGDEAEAWLVDSRGPLLEELVMRPGDLLYLPRGQYHDAVTGEGASLHVTFWVKPATGLSLFKLLEQAALADSAFRAYLPDGRDADALHARLVTLSERLDALLTSPAFAIELRNHQRAQATPPAGFDLPSRRPPQYYSTVKRGSLLRSREGFRLQIERTLVDVGSAHPAVSWLMQQRLFSIDDLMARFPFVDEAELRNVLRQLAAAGAIVVTEMR